MNKPKGDMNIKSILFFTVHNHHYLESKVSIAGNLGVGTLTMSRKKSTNGLLCTKNLTGCLSMVTLRMKSGGMLGLLACRITPS